MRVKLWVICLISAVVFGGCVSSKEYKARLAEIDTYKTDISALEGKLRAQKDETVRLQGQIDRLNSQLAELDKAKKAADADNAGLRELLSAKEGELTGQVLDLRGKLADSQAKEAALNNELRSAKMEISELKTDIASLSTEKAQVIEERDKAIAELTKTYDNLVSELNTEIEKGEVEITQLRDKLSLNMVEKILFASGSATVKKGGKEVLDRIGAILSKVTDKQIRVEGHTDNVPIGYKLSEKFPTNWELSTARATNVVRYLQEKAGVDPSKLSASGYAEYSPIAPNDTDEGRSKNRRIAIVLVPLEVATAQE